MNPEYVSGELQWIEDSPDLRSKDKQRLHVTEGGVDKGVFIIHVLDEGPNGERKEGHVLVQIAPTTPKLIEVERTNG